MKADLEGRETMSRTMETELSRKWKLLEDARVREDKLIHKLQQVVLFGKLCKPSPFNSIENQRFNIICTHNIHRSKVM